MGKWFFLNRSVSKILSSDNLAVGDTDTNYYQVLSIPRDASTAHIKSAYHRALLSFHPDKKHVRPHTHDTSPIDISLIKEAYAALSVPESRSTYDSLLSNQEQQWSSRPGFAGSRPAQVVSLEEFAMNAQPDPHPHSGRAATAGSELANDRDGNDEWAVYTYPCRCGGTYSLTTDDLESGHHLVGCDCCSEVVWVGYEEVVEND